MTNKLRFYPSTSYSYLANSPIRHQDSLLAGQKSATEATKIPQGYGVRVNRAANILSFPDGLPSHDILGEMARRVSYNSHVMLSIDHEAGRIAF